MSLKMDRKPWRWVGISSLACALVAGLLWQAFLLYMIIAAEGRVDDFCEMTEIGEGLLPYGDEGGCDPRWLVWGLFFLIYAGKGDHRHIRGRETAYAFTDPGQLQVDFWTDVDLWRRR